jgi:hypothetical protein
MTQNHPNFNVALEFVKEAGTMSTYLNTIDITYQQILDRIRQINGNNGDNAAVMFRDLLKRELEKEVTSLEVVLASVYAEQFSSQELKQLKAFFVTPVGQKLINATTSIAQEFANKSVDFQQKMASVIMPKIQMEFKMQGFQM